MQSKTPVFPAFFIMCSALLCISLDVKKPTLRLAFLSPAEKLLLLGGSSGSSSGVFSAVGSGRSSGFSRLGISSRGGSFSGLGFGSRSSGRCSFCGLGFSSRGSSGGRSFDGLRLFLLAAGGNSECNESSNQERLFHCWFPLSINEVQQAKFRSNRVGDPIWSECYHGGSA